MPASLPIDAVLPELVAALRRHPAVVLRAPTGAGKTTRVPPALLDADLAGRGRVIVLEPRRLAARAAARRIAAERGQSVGAEIGYHVRFERQAGPLTRLLVATPGIVLRMLQSDPFLESVGVLVFDEFHERSLDVDLTLGMARLVQQTVRPELRLVVMSATLGAETIAAYLGDCPVITSEGRLHPVEIRHEERSLAQPWSVAAAGAVERLLARTAGDVLVFLPGMQEIRATQRELEAVARSHELAVLPLHGDLPAEEQDRALLPQSRRKVVLATNVAETSVTVEGITGVVDTGQARQLRFDPAVGMDRLELIPIACDAADQRAGRAGRTGPGVCVRLWSEASHRQRAALTEPEIRRIDLAGAVLQLVAYGETDVTRFPWLEPPRPDAVAQAQALLHRLGALDEGGITATGQILARLPIHPRLGRMLVTGWQLGAPDRVALAAALLSERDPFLRGPEHPRPPANGRHATPSDLLDRVEVLEEYERTGRVETPLGTLHVGAARGLLRVRDQLRRLLRQELPAVPATPTLPSDEAVLRAVLAAFPDRLIRRRAPGEARGVMVGGRGVRLAASSRVIEPELFIGVDVDGAGVEALVRQASAIERDWLSTESLCTSIEVDFEPQSESVRARRRVRYEDLLLDESVAALPSAEETARVLTEAACRRIDAVVPLDDSAAGLFLRRVRCLREWMPALDLPAFDEAALRDLLPWACVGCRSFAEVRRADWLGLLQGRLTPAQRQALEREAPERLEVPSGSRHALQYEPGRPPVLAVRIQELFGLHDTPRLAGGRVPVLLHLLAPNNRPQQVTDDLASFWANTYPVVRKELRARYPKHAWPDDPYAALAERGPRRRR